MADTETQQIEHEADPRAYFTMFPNLADDAGLDVYAFRLLIHYYRVGKCWESTRTTAAKTMMSASQVCQSRKDLEAAGWVKLGLSAHETISITLVDKWSENAEKYSKRSQSERGVHGVNGGVHTVNERRTSKEEPTKKATVVASAGRPTPSGPPALDLDEEDQSGYAKSVSLVLADPKATKYYCPECGEAVEFDAKNFDGTCAVGGHPVSLSYESGGEVKVKKVRVPLPPKTEAAKYLRSETGKKHPAKHWHEFLDAKQQVEWEQAEQAIGTPAMKGWVDWAVGKNMSKAEIVANILTAWRKRGAPKVEDADEDEALVQVAIGAPQIDFDRMLVERELYQMAENGHLLLFAERTGQHPFDYFTALAHSAPALFEMATRSTVAEWNAYMATKPSRTPKEG